MERVNHFKALGVSFHDDLKLSVHVENITKKPSRADILYLRECRRARLPKEVCHSIYTTLTTPILECGGPMWGGIPPYLKHVVERIQKRCLTLIGLPSDVVP